MATKGLLAKKIGMTQVFTEKGELLPVTVLEAGPCVVIALRAVQKDGYGAVQLGFGEAKEKKLTKPTAGHFKKAGVAAHRHVREIRLKADAPAYEVGQALKADLFSAGELVDVTGTTKGKGFSGQHKRHHFGRGPVTHGSHNIRQPGSVGSVDAARTWKGVKMAGQMGNARVTQHGLTVVKVDLERNLLMVRGAVPGPKNGIVMLKESH